MKQIWNEIITSVINQDIYAAVDSAKLAYFAHMFGFTATDQEVIDNKGTRRSVMVCTL